MVDPDEIRRLWAAAGGGPAGSPTGSGLMGFPVVDDPEALSGAALAAVGLPWGGASGAPAAVRSASAIYAGWAAATGGVPLGVDYGDVTVSPGDLEATFVRAHERLADIFAAGAMPLVLGGDGVVSLPVLQVLSGKLRGRLGVVAFGPSYGIAAEPRHGAASRWARALELGVVVPANLVLIGGRETPPDAPARRVLDGLGVSTYGVADVARDGMPTIAEEALETAATGTEAVYLSVDMEVLAGAGDPIGLTARELARGVAVVATGLLAAADVCGGGPGKGGGDGVARVAARVVAEIVAGIAERIA